MLRTSSSGGGTARNDGMIACWFFVGSCFVLNFYVKFVTGFSFCFCPFLKDQIVWFGFVWRLFGVLFSLFQTYQ